ncbi:MAG: hypothetical protein WD269_09770 [Acidimicrobiia bacterium]
MSRLHRFEAYRFIGARDTMWVYDCDDVGQFGELEARLTDDDLLGRNLLQAFSPDTVDEAVNRGFKPRRVPARH